MLDATSRAHNMAYVTTLYCVTYLAMLDATSHAHNMAYVTILYCVCGNDT